MNCEQIQELLPDYWAETLGSAARVGLEVHLGECEACRREAEALRVLWIGLGLVPAADKLEPSREMRARFYSSLTSYQQGMAAARPARSGFADWIAGWWPRQPLQQFAAAAAMLVVGLVAGWELRRPAAPESSHEISQLKGEVTQMRQLVALSLLQQQSASERLRGINYAYQVDRSDDEVLNALLRTISQDSNVNVRLAAVDALRNFATEPAARRGLVDALGKQNSPLVQVAIIDTLVDLKVKQAVPAFRSLEGQPEISPEVKQRAQFAVQRLQ